MKECIYSSTAVADKMGRPAFNPSAFPAHKSNVEVIYLNGSFPEIEAQCAELNIETKPLSEMKQLKTTSNKDK